MGIKAELAGKATHLFEGWINPDIRRKNAEPRKATRKFNDIFDKAGGKEGESLTMSDISAIIEARINLDSIRNDSSDEQLKRTEQLKKACEDLELFENRYVVYAYFSNLQKDLETQLSGSFELTTFLKLQPRIRKCSAAKRLLLPESFPDTLSAQVSPVQPAGVR